MGPFLSEHENNNLYSYNAQEHGKWIYIRIAYGWWIGWGLFSYVCQSRWVRVGASQYAKQGEVIDVEQVTADDTAQQDWNHGDADAIENPDHTLLGSHRLNELLDRKSVV